MTQGNGLIDDLAAGDEQRTANELLRGVQQQLERLGGGQPTTGKPLGHISVPRGESFLFLPAGECRVDFKQGKVTHEQLGVVTDDLKSIPDLLNETGRDDLDLENLIFHADTRARVQLDNDDQWLNLDFVPIPAESFTEVRVQMEYPGQLLMLASTRRLPIGLGQLSIYASRIGEVSGTLDEKEPVPVTPHGLYATEGMTYSDPTLWAAAFDSTTFTVENTSGNGNEISAEIQAREVAPGNDAGLGTWRTIGTDTIPDGSHSVFNVTERHHYMRVRVGNTTTGQTVSAEVELTEASP